MNYEWMENHDIEAYVKYNMFHAEDKRKMRTNPFLVRNMYYNAVDDYYVCLRGQHLEHIGVELSTSELGYVSTIKDALLGDYITRRTSIGQKPRSV